LFVPPNSAHAHSSAVQNGRITISSDKRQRDNDTEDGDRKSKREKPDDDDDDDGEEMEIDEDEESAQPSTSTLTSGTSLYPVPPINCFLILHWKPQCLLLLSNRPRGYYAQTYRKK
jgi:hypothetical protein